MSAYVVQCQACGASIEAELRHLAAGDMDALYCSSCPKVLLARTSLLERFGLVRPPLGHLHPGFLPYLRHLLPYYAKVEALFRPCDCGGHFGFMNSPRCPKCNGLLRGDLYGDKPIAKVTDGYAIVSAGAVDDVGRLKPEFAEPTSP
ncbi:MAG TPA: hypothetical protein VF816_10510 [Rhodocyclaceae bacterium]